MNPPQLLPEWGQDSDIVSGLRTLYNMLDLRAKWISIGENTVEKRI
jgi:hypothetical protein